MSEQSYPVIVTYTEVHVVWVEADSPEDAVAMLQDEPHEYTSSSTSVDGDSKVAAPDEWDSHLVEQYAEAHVRAYYQHLYDQKRAGEKAECAAKGHPGAKTERDRIWCPVCWTLPLPAAVTS
jgi:hypothetical protein